MTASSPSTDVWTVARLLTWATDDFRARGIENPRLDAELLLAHTLACDRIRLFIDAQRPLAADELNQFKALIQRRRKHEPIAYILGKREFWGRSFRVNSAVLVPRPDTEVLVEVALDLTEPNHLLGQALDLCTGSGCVAISFALTRPTWRVWASDISAVALEVARENAQRLGAPGVIFRQGNLFEAVAGQTFSLVTANPPYIADREINTLASDIRDHEPRLALAGGADGLSVVRQIVSQASGFLADGGWLALEVGAGQALETIDIMRRAGLQNVNTKTDLGGHERVVFGSKPPQPSR